MVGHSRRDAGVLFCTWAKPITTKNGKITEKKRVDILYLQKSF